MVVQVDSAAEQPLAPSTVELSPETTASMMGYGR